MVYKVTLTLTSELSSLLDIYGAFLGRHIAMDPQRTAVLQGLTNVFLISRELSLLTQPGLCGIEVDHVAGQLRTNGRWISWTFETQEQARTFAQGLHYISTHRLTQDQVTAAQAQNHANRGLRWSPFVAFWGRGCCEWLSLHSTSLQIVLARVTGRNAQPLALEG